MKRKNRFVSLLIFALLMPTLAIKALAEPIIYDQNQTPLFIIKI